MLSVMPNSVRLWTCPKHVWTVCARTLFAAGRLGVDAYCDKRAQLAHSMADSKEDFYQRMERFADSGDRSVTTRDLTQLLHVATADEQDQALVRRMVARYHGDSKGIRFNRFHFGPVVMRMYWHFELADKALEAFSDPALAGFFDQLSSYVLLMDLLYKQGRYQDVLDTMTEAVEKRQVQGAMYPVDCITLTLAACYQMNCAASLEYCSTLLARLAEVGHVVRRRPASLAAALMLRQGAPHEAYQLLQHRTDGDRAMLRDIKAIALAELDRPAPAVETLRQPLLVDQPQHVRDAISVTQEAMNSVEEAVQKKKDAEITAKWKNVKQGLESYGLVKGNSLDEVLTRTISFLRKKPQHQTSALGAAFNRGRQPARTVMRPGLTDMVD